MKTDRRGFTLFELSVAGVLLVVLMGVTVQMLGWVAGARRAAERRLWAIQEGANVLERITAWPWNHITAERVESVELSAEVRQILPHSRLTIEVLAEPGVLAAKRLNLEITWKAQSDRVVEPIRLSAWVYEAKGARP